MAAPHTTVSRSHYFATPLTSLRTPARALAARLPPRIISAVRCAAAARARALFAAAKRAARYYGMAAYRLAASPPHSSPALLFLLARLHLRWRAVLALLPNIFYNAAGFRTVWRHRFATCPYRGSTPHAFLLPPAPITHYACALASCSGMLP